MNNGFMEHMREQRKDDVVLADSLSLAVAKKKKQVCIDHLAGGGRN